MNHKESFSYFLHKNYKVQLHNFDWTIQFLNHNSVYVPGRYHLSLCVISFHSLGGREDILEQRKAQSVATDYFLVLFWYNQSYFFIHCMWYNIVHLKKLSFSSNLLAFYIWWNNLWLVSTITIFLFSLLPSTHLSSLFSSLLSCLVAAVAPILI